MIVPTGFTEDKWVQMAEARPTNRPMVHHIIAYVREPGSSYFKDQKPGEFFVAPPSKEDEKADTSALPSDFLVGYAPGQPAEILQPGQAKLIKAGSDLVLEVHYMANGNGHHRPGAALGWSLPKTPPKQRVLTLSAVNGTFKIPPGDPDYRVDASFEVLTDLTLASLHPHMHTRGKDFEYRIVFPNGETRNASSRAALQLAAGSFGTTWPSRSLCPRAPRSSARRISTIPRTILKTPTPPKPSSGGSRAGTK